MKSTQTVNQFPVSEHHAAQLRFEADEEREQYERTRYNTRVGLPVAGLALIGAGIFVYTQSHETPASDCNPANVSYETADSNNLAGELSLDVNGVKVVTRLANSAALPPASSESYMFAEQDPAHC